MSVSRETSEEGKSKKFHVKQCGKQKNRKFHVKQNPVLTLVWESTGPKSGFRYLDG